MLVPNSVTVLVADDDAAVRQALADLISDEPGMRLVAIATNADEAIRFAGEHRPTVALLDVRMPGGGGLRAAREIGVCSPGTRVLALSAYEEKTGVYEMMDVGSSGYLVKGSSDAELVDAIFRTARGQLNMSANLATACFQDLLRDAREREHAEAVHRKSEEQFRGLLESALDAMVVVNARGEIEAVNMQVERLFRYERSELVGHPVERLLAERFREALVAHRERYIAMAQSRPTNVGLELTACRKDGSEFPVDISLSPLEADEGRLVAAIRDITERRQAAEAQRKSESQFIALIESSPDAMVMVDASGIIRLVNTQTELLFGYARGELIGRPAERLLPERFRDSHVFHPAPDRGNPTTGPPRATLDLVGRRKDGSEFPTDISMSVISSDAGQLAAARVRDLTERKRAAADLEASFELVRKIGLERQELLGHLVRAEEAERLRISADIHDDSIQAMTAAGLRLQQLRKRLTTTKEVEALDKLEEAIQGSVSRLRHLMFDLRPLALDRTGLAAALRTQLERIQSEVGLEFEVENRLTTEPPSETRVILYRIAMEALVNVRKHARAHRVRVRLEDVDRGWEAQINDDGDGFLPNGGSAPGHLGLTAMRERAQMAGGWWKLESSPGSGTNISFWLPAVEPVPQVVLPRLSA
ncbi:MAG TPA: PAS domain S-box protein [Candidatus Dormibacteraeota bacterium]|nr:PAS domain S-box protein [Candidatus Dormibacteraeota bacterium]